MKNGGVLMTERKSLTQKMRKSYLKSPLRCPWCRSGEIESPGALEADSGEARQPVMCCKCGKHWTDIYRLTGVQEEL
ncbi:MAG TPA: hypothetical protein DET40_05025 [Lentisphaeria bacterium]|nr:MAG: hypothetical protein A2X45_13600 [Lentisphaerae bacterium GWF2_50_93]HCE42889.1 hypothetical protein [Lentisphaeria bacterium]